MLKASDFGDFEAELERRFELAFGFSWSVTEDSEEQARRRKEFKPLIAASKPSRSSESERALALMGDCYDLLTKLYAFLGRSETLADEMAQLVSNAFGIGSRLFRLLGPDCETDAADAPTRKAATAWRALEHHLRDAERGRTYGELSAEIRYQRDCVVGLHRRLRSVRPLLAKLKPSSRNEINSADWTEQHRALLDAIDTLLAQASSLVDECEPPSASELRFFGYFERVAQALLVRESPNARMPYRTEVPPSALEMPWPLRERRGAVLQRLCTRYPSFHPLLPAEVRRDHRPAQNTGGRGNRNTTLDGITAALILLGLVDSTGNGQQPRGEKLFRTTVKRVERWIVDEASKAAFFVDSPDVAPGRTRRSSVNKPLTLVFPRTGWHQDDR